MIECITYRPYGKDTGMLQGFANFYVSKWDVEISGCAVFMKDGKRWINFPSKEYTNAEGKKCYSPYIKFRERSRMDAFANEAKKSIDEYCKNNQPDEEPKKAEFDDSECPF